MRTACGGHPLRRVAGGGNVEVHLCACSEAGSDLAVVNETDVLKEGQRVRIRRDLDALDMFALGDSHDVGHQAATDSTPHPVWVDEQVFQLPDAARTKRGRKANDVIARPGGDAGAALADGL